MSNQRYPYGNQKILEGDIPWNTAAITAVLVGTAAYTYNSVHQHLSDIPAGARVATSGTLANRSSTLGVADADDVTFTAVTAGPRIDAIVLYKDTGVASTSPLIAYLSDGVGLPIYADGSNIKITWDNSANKIMKL